MSKLYEDAVLSRAGWISSVLIAGVLLAITMSLLRYTKATEFELLKIKFPVSAFPLSCVAYTVAHWYCALLFISVCQRVGHAPEIWQALTLKGPIVFAGMLPRKVLFYIQMGNVNVPVDQIAANDPTLWLFYGFCIVLYLGFTWAGQVAQYPKVKRHVLAGALFFVNWIIGSVWAHFASSLNG